MHQTIMYDVLERLNRMEILLAQVHWRTFATDQISGSTFTHTPVEQLDPSAPGPVECPSPSPSPSTFSSSKKRRLRAAASRRNLWAKASAAMTITSDVIPNAVHDTVPDAVYDAAPGPDVNPQVIPDAIPSPNPDTVTGTVFDVVPDAAPDAISGLVPDAVIDAVTVEDHETSEHMLIPEVQQQHSGHGNYCRAFGDHCSPNVARRGHFAPRRRTRLADNAQDVTTHGRVNCFSCHDILSATCFCKNEDFYLCHQCFSSWEQSLIREFHTDSRFNDNGSDEEYSDGFVEYDDNEEFSDGFMEYFAEDDEEEYFADNVEDEF